MLASGTILRLVDAAADLLTDHELPWVALTVWGFDDAPVSWGTHEHFAHHGAPENDYTLLLLPGGRCAVLYALSAEDAYKPPSREERAAAKRDGKRKRRGADASWPHTALATEIRNDSAAAPRDGEC